MPYATGNSLFSPFSQCRFLSFQSFFACMFPLFTGRIGIWAKNEKSDEQCGPESAGTYSARESRFPFIGLWCEQGTNGGGCGSVPIARRPLLALFPPIKSLCEDLTTLSVDLTAFASCTVYWNRISEKIEWQMLLCSPLCYCSISLLYSYWIKQSEDNSNALPPLPDSNSSQNTQSGPIFWPQGLFGN